VAATAANDSEGGAMMRTLILFCALSTMGQQLAPEEPIRSIDFPVRLRLKQQTGPDTADPIQFVTVARQGRIVRVSTLYHVIDVDGAWKSERECFCFDVEEWRQLLPAIQKAVQ
jgi:hypothetical protein